MGTEKRDTCSLSDFQFLSNGHVDRCPAGHQPALRKKKKSKRSRNRIFTSFSRCAMLIRNI
ncbi:MAG: hypothetical protein DRH32_09045 [Deltaproteobacteria bacterium]|nr:MAG: hypothetical protein DRH32_09045 [Deltaproteobacteria bacterium]